MNSAGSHEGIAIIGMAGRFPGAKSVEEYWHNLKQGIESISVFSAEQLRSLGVDAALLDNPNYVKAGGVLAGIEMFDASFFGFSAREAEIMDPQQRLFLECAWEALEDAGCDPETFGGEIGVYAGSGINGYLLNNLYGNRRFLETHDPFETAILSEKDFLATRVAYKLNLRGPALTIQTACSTSLVAVHTACQNLLDYQCDIALAGGVRINAQLANGYLYEEGMIFAPDGHCRAFDEKARGTVRGNGVGVVVLKRLADALANRDFVYAVIKGSAVNNDGSTKVGYTAPSVDGQAKVIAMAQAMSGVNPETIGYIEAHGTGTSLGDPIEIAGLTQAFRAKTQQKACCAIGSVKTNIGHTDAAAGVAGLIKASLALRHHLLPPSLHFEKPNPEIDFENSPFYVNTQLRTWNRGSAPRRAGVSSFGIGGTNAHAVIEEAPPFEASGPSKPWQVFPLSAKTRSALDTTASNLAEHLDRHPELNIADVAFTLQVGRKAFNHRRVLVCQGRTDAVNALRNTDSRSILASDQEVKDRGVVFMFPGQGSQYVNMGRELYDAEPTFRLELDRCAELLAPKMGMDLRKILYPGQEDVEETAKRLNDTLVAQPALFAVEYALAQLLVSWGIKPQAMIGHSVGEYVAAFLAGVFSLEDGLSLIAARGRLMDQLPGGTMLAVPLPLDKVQPLLSDAIALAAHNGPRLCVLSGQAEELQQLEDRLKRMEIECRRLHTSHAFHSPMMEPVLRQFTDEVRKVKLSPPTLAYVSNVSGGWITPADSTDPHYWAKQLRGTVRFSEGLQELLRKPDGIFLEVGPGQTLGSAAKLHRSDTRSHVVLSSMKRPQESQSDVPVLLDAVGRLWLAGIRVDWGVLSDSQCRRRVPLPTYPFERQRYWMEPQVQHGSRGKGPLYSSKNPDIADWFYLPSWKRSAPSTLDESVFTRSKACWLLFVDECGVGTRLAGWLEQHGQDVITIQAGDEFRKIAPNTYTISPQNRDDYHTLLGELDQSNQQPSEVLHCWSVTPAKRTSSLLASVNRSQDLGLYSLLFLAQSFGERQVVHPVDILVVSNHMHEVTGEETLAPEKATVLGACKIIPLEYSNLSCRSVDITLQSAESFEAKLIDALFADITQSSDPVIAYRGTHRWVPCFEPVRLEKLNEIASRLRQGGVYLITGGLGGVGLTLAEHLARTVRARLILIGRSLFPAREEWEDWISSHDEGDPISFKIHKLRACEAAGAEVLVLSADVASLDQMQNALTRATTQFGQIHGVIHAAGSADYAGIIDQRTREMTESVLRPKLMGALVLDELLRPTKLDFFVVCSSLSSVLYRGKFGQVGYCAANEFLDAFARYKSLNDKTFAVSINWSDWQEVGMAVEARKRWAKRRGILQDSSVYKEALSLRDALAPSDGAEVFYRILGTNFSQIAVSTRDLLLLIEEDKESLSPAFINDFERATARETKHARPELVNSYAGPRNQAEETLTQVWQDLLGFEQIGIHDNFFELGGHSLLATQVVSRVRTALQVELPLRTLFEAPTIAKLAIKIATLGSVGPTFGDRALHRIDRERIDRLPLSFAQQRLWFLEQMDGELTAYNMPYAWRLRGPLNTEALRRALEEIVRRHEPLRTTFAVVDGEPVQVIRGMERCELPLEDLRGFGPEQQSEEVMRRCREEAERPFDLTRDLMLRTLQLRLGEDEHVLLLTMHHIASDGWSVAVFWRELGFLYEACRGDADAGLPDLPVQYADYAGWQRKQLEGERLAGLLEYWRQQLDGVTPLELPVDRPRPPRPSYRGARHDFMLGSELFRQLKLLSQGEGVTLHMTLLAAFQTLLSRYSGQDDVAVGTPIAGRNHAALEDLIGFFVNTLVLRTDLSGNPTFRDLLGRVRHISLAAYDHQDLPFEKLVEELHPQRHLNRNPLVQVMFQMLNLSDKGLTLRDLDVARLPQSGGRVRFDLEMYLWQQLEDLRCGIVYSADLFDASTIKRMVEHFVTLLEGIAADADQRISELPLLTEVERNRLLEEWNDTAVTYPFDKCVHELFEQQVERTPDNVALVFQEQRLTYRELDRRASQLACHLLAKDVSPGSLVGICVERSVEMIVGILGILKAGAGYIPLDPRYPSGRLQFILGDTRSSLVLTQNNLATRITEFDGTVVLLDRADGPLADPPATMPRVEIKSDCVAYIIYTSGSTGTPKGVAVQHAALATHCRVMRDHYRITSSDRVLQFSSFSFDPSIEQIFVPLTCGAPIVVSSDDDRDPNRLTDLLVREQVTVMNLPTAYWEQWVRNMANPEHHDTLSALRLVIVGGEAMSPDAVRVWNRLPLSESTTLLNAYGPTEATITTTTHHVTCVPDSGLIPIGRPLPARTLYVLGTHGELVPTGVPGELHIGGHALARGYLNHPALTAERFVANPFDDDPDSRLYRTGDLCRWRADGNLVFLGRIDDQVKLRGFRVELGEIESVLNEDPSVAQSIVTLREDRPGDKRLVAYCVPVADSALDFSELRRHLLNRLPDYMVPAAFVALDTLPLTTSGKVNRRALPAPDDSWPVLEYVAARDPLEEQLASIWCDVLGIERVGIYDSFFELGGHSLSATQVVSRVRSKLHVELSLRSFFETPTVAELAAIITQNPRSDQCNLDRLLAEVENLSDDEAQQKPSQIQSERIS